MSPPTTPMHVTAIQGTTTSSTNNTSSVANMPSRVIYTSSKSQYPTCSFGSSYNSGEERVNNNNKNKNNSVVGVSDKNSLCCETAISSNSASTKNKNYFGLPLKSNEMLGEISPQQSSFSTEITRVPVEVGPSPPPKPKRWNNCNNNSVDYANISISSGGHAAVTLDNSSYRIGTSSCDASKSHSMTDFSYLKQQLVKSSDNQYLEAEDSTFLESNLMKLQARKELSGNGQCMGIDGTNRTMKDCQDYLMASFDMAEREGERLVKTVPVATTISSTSNIGLPYLSGPTMGARTNRSAESSPIATMQKKSVLQPVSYTHLTLPTICSV